MTLEIAGRAVDGGARRNAPVTRSVVLAVVSAFSFGAAGCHFHAEEPRQRQDFSDPPVQYGATRFSGMALPAADAGPPVAR
jgi:hypothetical protein